MSIAKDIRKQIKNVMQEYAKDILVQEVCVLVEKRLLAFLTQRLNMIDERQKDIQSFQIRKAAEQNVKG